MTANQIAYMARLEEHRHNVTYENETERHNLATEAFNIKSLTETTRHNKATENLTEKQIIFNYDQLAETRRHNVVTEGETQRHNVAGERETQRHNVETETFNINKLNREMEYNYANLNEVTRHNKAQESIGRTQASASIMQAQAAQRQAATAEYNADTQRRAVESNIIRNETLNYVDSMNAETNRYTFYWRIGDTIADTGASIVRSVSRLIPGGGAAGSIANIVGNTASGAVADYTDVEDYWNSYG